MAARAISSTSVSFGLVSIPVKLYTTIETGGQISFNALHRCGSRLEQQQQRGPEDEKGVPRDEVAKSENVPKPAPRKAGSKR